jgi:threonine dehydratase
MDRGIAAAAYEAYASTRFLLRSTPLEPAPWLAAAITAAASHADTADAPRVFLKLESEQRTGSFKARGALNKVLRTFRNGGGDGVAGFTTASTGNHALATIMAVQAATTQQQQQQRQTPLELVIYVAENADATKVARLRTAASASSSSTAVRIRVEVEGLDCAEAEAAARRAAEGDDQTGERGAWRYISPYNDLEVIAGQGSLAVEMLAQLRSARQQQGKQPPRPLAVFVPVGGGGLIAGVAAVLKAAASDTTPLIEVYGCQPAVNDIMRRSVAEGELLDLPEVAEAATLSDATAGGVEPGAATFDLCQSLVDHWVAVDEQEIADAVCSVLEHSGKLVEGSAGVAIAAALRVARETPERLRGKDVAVVCCGGNVGVETLKKVLERGRAVELGRVTL